MYSDLATQLKVCHHYGNLSACDDEYDKDEEEKSKKIIKLVFPNCGQNEEQFNKHSSKW